MGKEEEGTKESDSVTKRLEVDLRKKVVAEVAKAWNDFVMGQIKAVVAWEKYCQLRIEEDVQLEEFSQQAQKALWLANPRGDYSFILEDLVTQPPIKEFLKEHLIKID